MSKVALTLRLSCYYAALFFGIGLMIPFWPIYLQTRGLGAAEIGIALALASWIKVVAVPAFGRIADPPGRGRPTLLILALLTVLTLLAYGLVSGYWPIIFLQLALGAFMTPLFPLGDAQVMQAVKSLGVDYGRVRMVGSLFFIVGNLVGGWLIALEDKSAFHLSVVASQVVMLATVWALPKRSPEARRDTTPHYRALLKCRPFWWLVAAGAVLQASHGAFLSIASLAWKEAGLSESTIAWIWAVSVLGEVAALAIGTFLVRRFSPAQLMAFAAVAGLLRWVINAVTLDPALLMLAQALHGLTFAATHLATVYLVVRAVPPGLASSGQSLYAAIQSGVFMGLAIWLSALLYEHGDATIAYLSMAAISGLGLVIVWRGWAWLAEPPQVVP